MGNSVSRPVSLKKSDPCSLVGHQLPVPLSASGGAWEPSLTPAGVLTGLIWCGSCERSPSVCERMCTTALS